MASTNGNERMISSVTARGGIALERRLDIRLQQLAHKRQGPREFFHDRRRFPVGAFGISHPDALSHLLLQAADHGKKPLARSVAETCRPGSRRHHAGPGTRVAGGPRISAQRRASRGCCACCVHSARRIDHRRRAVRQGASLGACPWMARLLVTTASRLIPWQLRQQ